MDGIVIANFTTLFKRELLLYSIGSEITLPKPVALKTVLYFILFSVIWIAPIVSIFGIIFNVFYAFLLIVPPAALASFAGRPIWGGMSLFAWIQTQIHYLREAPFYTDLEPDKGEETIEQINYDIWVSRRREMVYLSSLENK